MCVFSHSRVYTVKSTGTKGDKVTSLLTMEKGIEKMVFIQA